MNRATAIFMFSVLASGVAGASETGWKISWNASASGNAAIEWDSDVGTHIETRKFAGTVSEKYSGYYLIDPDGYVIEGSSGGSRTRTLSEDHLNWLCGFGEILQHVDSHWESMETETISGPGVGDQVFVSESVDGATGVRWADIRVNRSCAGESTYSENTFSPSYCTPQNSSGSNPINQCSTPFYASWERPEAEDDTNLIFSSSGSRQVDWIFYDQSYVLGYPDLPAGPVVVTWEVRAEKIVLPTIHGIELTQAIQVYQPLEELKAQLENNDGNPPVPLVSYKPLAIRVMLDEVEESQDYIVEAYWNGWALDESPITLTQSATCLPPDTTGVSVLSSRESLRPDCRTADFYVEAPHPGLHEVRVILRTSEGELMADEVLYVRTKVSDSVAVGAVNICSEKTSLGKWDCLFAPVRELDRGVRLMREIYPTDEVIAESTGHQVRLEIIGNANAASGDTDELDCYDASGTQVLGISLSADGQELLVDEWTSPLSRVVKCERIIWAFVAAERVARLYGETNRLLEWAGGVQWFYYGLFKWNSLLPVGGLAAGIPNPADSDPARGAIGYAKEGLPAKTENPERLVKETIAHEIGHLLGRRHTNLASDVSLAPGCKLAWDPNTDYPSSYPDSNLWSGSPFPDEYAPLKDEVGFHVKRKSVRRSYDYRDIMSYCRPKWITPFTYKKLHELLDPPPPPPPGTVGSFWVISGLIDDAEVYLDAIYGIDTTGPLETGEGSHRIEVINGNGDVLFVRNFTPRAPHVDSIDFGDASLSGLSMFAELVPVQPEATNIIVLNNLDAVLTDTALGGAAPVINFMFPNGGEQLDGEQEIIWSADDPDTEADDLFYWVQYSSDGGNRWLTLAQDVPDTALSVNFDMLPGSGHALVRVIGSDGVNTGTATSAAFSVSRKLPTVDIALPEHGQTEPIGETIFFEGYGYDLESGRLPSHMHDWSSDRDGYLGSASRFSTSDLSEGTHIIELLVIDGDGNTATDRIVLIVGATTDSDGDGVDDTADNCPATPAGEQVDANGCSASQLDDDGDGVNDAADQCPNTPAGEAVDNGGCAASQRDSDGDGVSDVLDQCPGTAAGTAVGSDGCATVQPTGGGSSSGGGGGGGFDCVGLFVLGLVAVRRRRGTA